MEPILEGETRGCRLFAVAHMSHFNSLAIPAASQVPPLTVSYFKYLKLF
jgi:hypothetical protein